MALRINLYVDTGSRARGPQNNRATEPQLASQNSSQKLEFPAALPIAKLKEIETGHCSVTRLFCGPPARAQIWPTVTHTWRAPRRTVYAGATSNCSSSMTVMVVECLLPASSSGIKKGQRDEPSVNRIVVIDLMPTNLAYQDSLRLLITMGLIDGVFGPQYKSWEDLMVLGSGERSKIYHHHLDVEYQFIFVV
ncbi:MAG: hypothetical protein M1823_005500, partial [Watsoniomyces obsoletus]